MERSKDMRPTPFREVLTEKIDDVTQEFSPKVRLATRRYLQVDKPSNVYSRAAGVGEMRLVVAVGNGEKF